MSPLPAELWIGLCAAGLALAVALGLPAGRSALRRLDPPATPRRLRHRRRERPAVRRRERQLAVQQAPEALDLMAACVATGLPVRSACRAVAGVLDPPLSVDLARVATLAELGRPETEAWRSLQGHPVLGPAAGDLARAVDSGTRLEEVLREHAADAREHRQVALQVTARGVGVRSVLPLAVCFLPSFLLLGVVPSVASAVLTAFG